MVEACRDKIFLDGMEFYAYHGVLPEESRLGQRFRLDLELGLDLAAAGQSDDPADTVDYARVYQQVKQVVVGERYNLLEALAWAVAKAVLGENPRVVRVRVRVEKPGAPVPASLRTLGVEIERWRQDSR